MRRFAEVYLKRRLLVEKERYTAQEGGLRSWNKVYTIYMFYKYTINTIYKYVL